MTDKQRYIHIIEHANELMRDAAMQPKEIYLVNKRIFNNAFASIMRLGVPATLSDDMTLITIRAGSNSYITRAEAVEKILRSDYRTILEICLATNPIFDESDPMDFNDVFGDKMAEIELSNFDFMLPEITAEEAKGEQDIIGNKDTETANNGLTEEFGLLRDVEDVPLIIEESDSKDVTYEEDLPSDDDAVDKDNAPDEPEKGSRIEPLTYEYEDEEYTEGFSIEGESSEEEEKEEEPQSKIVNLFTIKDVSPSVEQKSSEEVRAVDEELEQPACAAEDHFSRKNQFRVIKTSDLEREEYSTKGRQTTGKEHSNDVNNNERGGSPDIDISQSLFVPKNRPDPEITAEQELFEEDSVLEKKPTKKRGLLGLFRKDKKNAPKEETKDTFVPKGTAAEYTFTPNVAYKNETQVQTPQKEVFDTTNKIIAEERPEIDYTHDGGELFQHIKNVALIKKLGTDTIGPYRFIFWPINIPKNPTRTFAEMLVYSIDTTTGAEGVYLCDKNNPELIIRLGDKDFKVYGIWENGEFTSVVTAIGKTASIFDLKEQTEKIMPDILDEVFYEQFRLEKKGQPKHFVLPFKNTNRGEKNIPIIGYVEFDGNKKPLRRQKGNTLIYRFYGREYEIKGHYESGKFTYTVEPKQQTRFG